MPDWRDLQGRWPTLGDDVRPAPPAPRGEGLERAAAAPTLIAASGVAIIDGMLSGLAWSSPSLTFAFPTDPLSYEGSGGYADGAEQDQNFEAFNVMQQQAVTTLLAAIANLTDLSFTLVAESESVHGDLRFGMSDAAEAAYAYLPSGDEAGGDAWFNNSSGDFDAPTLGTYAYMTLLHEIGHALGLDHPFDPNVYGAIPLGWDSTEYTVMTYRSAIGSDLLGYTNAEFSFPQSLMMLDILALQYMYGADYTYNSGDTIYTFSPTTGEMFVNGVGQGAPGANTVFLTIWDGGGVDTYDFTAYGSQDLFIDLEPGYVSTLAPGQLAVLDQFNNITASGNVYNALLFSGDTRSLIENAIGGEGDDIFYGNSANNTMIGNRGADYFVADLGADTYYGMTAEFSDVNVDIVSYELSPNSISINTVTGAVSGAYAIGDTYVHVEGLAGSQFNDTITGFAYLFGLGGNDTLNGDLGSDYIDGGDGDDLLISSDGADRFVGGAGVDTVTYAGLASSVFINMATGNNTGDEEFGDTYAGVEIIVGTGFADQMFGDGGANTLMGGAGNDNLVGGSGDDVLVPGSGANTVDGGAGNDIVSYADISTWFGTGGITLRVSGISFRSGEISDDTLTSIEGIIGTNAGDWLEMDNGPNYISGGGGDDTLRAFAGNDTIYGGSGNDDINAGADTDLVYGGDGNDLINGSTGNDVLYGEAGSDRLDGGAGVDQMAGGTGDDIYIVDNAGDVVSENAADGLDRVEASITHALGANVENLILTGAAAINGYGNALDNAITGNSAANTLNGGGGNDVLDGGGGADAMTGNLGDDTYYVDAAGDTVSEGNIAGGTDTVFASVSFSLASTGYADHLTLTGASAINGAGNSLNNTITGNDAVNVLQGSLGDDTLNAGAGADTLYGGDGLDTVDGGTGADTMIGNLGDDSYYVDDAGDVVLEGNIAGGTDQVFAAVTFNLGPTGYADQLTLMGSANIDGFGNILGNTLTGNSGVNALWGNGGDDTLIAGDGADSLYGGDGADSLDGGTGADTMIGNFGNDTYYVDNAGDVVSEGNVAGGTDIVYASVTFNLGPTGFADHLTLLDGAAINGTGNGLNNTLTGNSAANVLTGNAGNDTLYGMDGADTLYGGDGADTLDGGTGADAMIGNAGDDAYYVDDGGDTVSEGSNVGGTDIVYASVSFNLAPTGFAENLTLTGTDAINATGNNLANTLTGNAAANTLTGAGGADSFVFASALGAGNVDAIADYSVSDDTIVLNNSVFTGLTAGALDAGAFVIGSSAADADDRIIYDSATGQLFFDADGAGGADQVLFATLTAGLALTSADFIVSGP